MQKYKCEVTQSEDSKLWHIKIDGIWVGCFPPNFKEQAKRVESTMNACLHLENPIEDIKKLIRVLKEAQKYTMWGSEIEKKIDEALALIKE